MSSAAAVANRWFEEIWNNDNDAAIDEMFPPDGVLHDANTTVTGPEGFRRFRQMLKASFSDIRVTVHASVGQGDMACIRWSSTMVHTGEFAGFAPTGKELRVTGMSMVHERDGKIVEAWQNWDMLGLLEAIRGAAETSPTYMAAHM